VAIATVVATLAPAARAEDSDEAEITKMAKEHYKLGLDAYKAGKYDVAIKELKKAYLLKRLPALLLNIGATYRKMGDTELALHFYKKYLDEAPADAKDRPEIEGIVNELNQQKASSGGASARSSGGDSGEEPAPRRRTPPPSDEEAPPPPRRHAADDDRTSMPREWSHTVVDAAPPDSPLDVRVSTPVMKGVKVYLNYRGAGEENFTTVIMKRRGPEKIGRIPADAMRGKSIQYYIEAKDPTGAVVKSSGSASDPNIVMIDPSAQPQMVASYDDRGEDRGDRDRGADEEERPRKKKQRTISDDEEAPVTGRVDDYDNEAYKKPPKRRDSGGGMSPMMIAGIATLSVGVAGLAVGGGMLGLAKSNSDQIEAYTKDPYFTADNGMKLPVYFSNDPNCGDGCTQLNTLEAQGKAANAAGIALSVVGGLASVTGAILIAVDQTVMKGGGSERPKKKRRPRPVEEDAWHVTPVLGPQVAGVSAGFSF
jgi:hypothetical protein